MSLAVIVIDLLPNIYIMDWRKSRKMETGNNQVSSLPFDLGEISIEVLSNSVGDYL